MNFISIKLFSKASSNIYDESRAYRGFLHGLVMETSLKRCHFGPSVHDNTKTFSGRGDSQKRGLRKNKLSQPVEQSDSRVAGL